MIANVTFLLKTKELLSIHMAAVPLYQKGDKLYLSIENLSGGKFENIAELKTQLYSVVDVEHSIKRTYTMQNIIDVVIVQVMLKKEIMK